MKPLVQITCFIALIYLQSCGGSMIKHTDKDTNGDSFTVDSPRPKTDPVLNADYPVPKATPALVIKTKKDLNGYWVGNFKPDTSLEPVVAGDHNVWDYGNKINISIDSINGDKVLGHSVVAGNLRPFSGTLEKAGSTYKFVVKEPGDDKYDGAFKFAISESDSVVSGTWKANNNIRIPLRKYELTKKLFHYDPNYSLDYRRYVDWNKKKAVHYNDDEIGDYTDTSYFMTTADITKYNMSTYMLSEQQAANLKKADIYILRNSIFARHGYSFKKQPLRVYFDRQAWYVPVSTDVRKDLTAIEKHNLDLLLRYEKTAKAYYDVFGR